MLKRVLGVAGLAFAVMTFVAGPAFADVLETIKDRGKLIVGVKADYKPYGFLDPSGAIVGVEPDLAADVANKLGVELELVPVVASNRIEFLEQGKIDLLIATMTDTEKRRQRINILQPNYYSSGTNVMAKKGSGLSLWTDLDGRNVCGVQGAFYNKKTGAEFGANIVAFAGTAEALTALKSGRCVGFVYDDSFLVSKLSEEDWADFEMALETIDDSPWGMAVAHGEDAFAEFMSETIIEWHKSGRIIELEQNWGVSPTPFAQMMHDKFM
ncbi:MAG: transporter substrate-binding domain-containing protein [Alphaproteobacteria bacterium]